MRPAFLQSFKTTNTTLVVFLFVLLASNALTSDLSPNGDNASYIALAESLVNGTGYTNTIYPGEPAETQYPPLLPVLLLPIIAFLGKNYFVMKLIAFFFGILTLPILFRLLREITQEDNAWLVVLLTALNANFLLFSSSILTETIYTFLSIWALIILRKAVDNDTLNMRVLLLLAVLTTLSFYARSIGASLAMTVCLYLFFKKQYKAAILVGILIGLMLLPWGLRSIDVRNSYFSQLTEQSAGETDTGPFIVLFRVLQNIPRYMGKVMIDLIGGPDIASFSPYNPIKVVVSVCLSALFLWGFLFRLRQDFSPEKLYLLIYLSILIVWPYHDSRFLVPILPFVFLFIIEGVSNIPLSASVRPKATNSLITALLLLGLATSVCHIYQNRTQYYSPEISNFKMACEWIRSHTPSDAIIISRKPRIAAIWAERKSWWYTKPEMIPDKDLLGNPMQVTHIVVTDFPVAGVNLYEGFQNLLRETPDKYQLVYQTPSPAVFVYEAKKQP